MSGPYQTSLLVSAGALVGGKYLLVERIAEGGMGHLWRAVHRGLDREVALKLVDMEPPGAEERVARILREAAICAAVRHRYVVEIHDVDTMPNGQPYIVMELLRGETLGQRLSRGPSMRLDELVGVLAQCLSGLHAVHEAGVVHRDLKPDNIVLSESRTDGIVPKIVDFGISCRAWTISSREQRLTRQGTVLGTPWYMPPEQASGEVLGPAADIYAMGVIAYEALTGRLPFDSDALVPLLLKIAISDAPPVSYFRPDLPVALSEAVSKAMARAPADRFRTALELRDALLAAVAGADPSYAAIVPSEGVMVLPGDPEPQPEPPPPVAFATPPRVEASGHGRRRMGQAVVSACAALSFLCVAGALVPGGDVPVEAPLAAPEPRDRRESVRVGVDAVPASTASASVEQEPAADAAERQRRATPAVAEPDHDPPAKRPVRRRRAVAPVAFRELDL